MNRYIAETMNNIENYLEKSKSAYCGMLSGDQMGGFRRVVTNDRNYFVIIFVDEQMQMFFVDVFPGCFCEKPYRVMMNAYLNEKTSSYKCGRVNVDADNGEVSIRVTSSIEGQAVSEEAIESMVTLAINISDSLEKRLDKMAHGVYFKDDDPELIGTAKKTCEELMEKLGSMAGSYDESDDEFNEDFDHESFDESDNDYHEDPRMLLLGQVEDKLLGDFGGFDALDDDDDYKEEGDEEES